MKKTTNILWGVVLVAIGALLALNVLDVVDFNIFFDGWWTLIIIIPCAIGLFADGDKLGNVIGILIGVLLLLGAQDIIRFEMLWKLAVPIIIILIGVKLIFGGVFKSKRAKLAATITLEGADIPNGSAVFSEQNLNFDGEVFRGAELNAVFGGIKCDLRGAVIERDCVINASTIFGGITIFVPENICVKCNSNSIFGGITNKTAAKRDANLPTVYINGTCMFGGIDIK